MKSKHKCAAFTLIELLIAIGILTIIVGLAAESYQAASIRAKVSRIKSDFRAYAAAIEAYAVDLNAVPRMRSYNYYKDPNLDMVLGQRVNGVLSPVLTTPVCYIASIMTIDPFMTDDTLANIDERLYSYHDIPASIAHEPESLFWPKAKEFYGPWRLISVGPDRTIGHGFPNSAQLPYDPTNGLVSFGNISYSPGSSNDRMPPVPELLGAH